MGNCCAGAGASTARGARTHQNIEHVVDFFTFEGTYDAFVTHVYDGDTVHIQFVFEGKVRRVRCRLYGIDAPELAISKSDLDRDAKKELGLRAKNKLIEILQAANRRYYVIAEVQKEFDKYGRILAKLYIVRGNDIVDVSAEMIRTNNAKPYFGGKKE